MQDKVERNKMSCPKLSSLESTHKDPMLHQRVKRHTTTTTTSTTITTTTIILHIKRRSNPYLISGFG